VRAAKNGRSAEAEVRAILDEVVRPRDRTRVGSALAAAFRPYADLYVEVGRDRSPAEAPDPE
jgi:plasmid stability protein